MKSKKMIPYEVIVAAKNGGGEAMDPMFRHYEPYIIRSLMGISVSSYKRKRDLL